jgi:cytochrome c553
MKIIGEKLACPAVLAIAFAGACSASERDFVPNKDFDGKIQYCETCHGLSGQGFRGAYPMPRLAGQQPEYRIN